MRRTTVAQARFHSEQLAPGVQLERFHPGGRRGPNDETFNAVPGGLTWSELLLLGGKDDGFQMLVPDIRLPQNQLWPLHWHDCWTAVVILEGTCCIGDWWMGPGDVFITEPSLEYGPLVIGPSGCRMFEIFAKAHLSPGGYSPEYRDHPTLQGVDASFSERSALNRRNEGRSTLPCDGVPGLTKTRLTPGAVYDLGAAGDPERGVMKDTRLAAGESLTARVFGDWYSMIVLGGSLEVDGRTLGPDDYLLVKPGGVVPALSGVSESAQLLELWRTAAGATLAPTGDARAQVSA